MLKYEKIHIWKFEASNASEIIYILYDIVLYMMFNALNLMER